METTRTVDTDLLAVRAIRTRQPQGDGDVIVRLKTWGSPGAAQRVDGYQARQYRWIGDNGVPVAEATRSEWFSRLPQSLVAAVERYERTWDGWGNGEMPHERRERVAAIEAELDREIAAYAAGRQERGR